MLILLLSIAALPSPAAHAQELGHVRPTRLLPVSGILTDATGSPLSGTRLVTFALFEAQDGPTSLWTESVKVQVDGQGRYTAVLGSSGDLPLEIFRDEQARWLGVSADGHEQPRILLVAVPYALKAADADTLGGTPASDFAVRNRRRKEAPGHITGEPYATGLPLEGTGTTHQLAKFTGPDTIGNSILTDAGTNRIGIGTTDPTEGGALDAEVTIRASDGITALAASSAAGAPNFALNNNFNASFSLYDRVGGIFNLGIAQRGGRVAIGGLDATFGGIIDSRFTVTNADNNTALGILDPAGARRFALNTLSTGGWAMYDALGGRWNLGLTQRDGKIGIRTVAPVAGLHIHQVGTDGGAARFYQFALVSNYPLRIVNDGNGSALFIQSGPTSAAPALVVTDPRSGSGVAEFQLAGTGGDILIGKQGGVNRLRVNNAGTIFAASYQTGGADFAEAFDPAAQTALEPGDVLVISEDRDRAVDLARSPYSSRAAGVYSTQPGILASPYPVDDPRRAGKLPLAVVGVVLCKVSAENGPIARGDLLVTAETAGHAMKGTDRNRMPGSIIGKALQPLPEGTGVILVLLTLQ